MFIEEKREKYCGFTKVEEKDYDKLDYSKADRMELRGDPFKNESQVEEAIQRGIYQRNLAAEMRDVFCIINLDPLGIPSEQDWHLKAKLRKTEIKRDRITKRNRKKSVTYISSYKDFLR